jgi:hypothetical protein
MREVSIVGADMTPFGRHLDRTLPGLGGDAVRGAIRDAGATRADIQAVYSGNMTGGSLAGQRIVRDLGLGGIPVVNVEHAWPLRPGSGASNRDHRSTRLAPARSAPFRHHPTSPASRTAQHP